MTRNGSRRNIEGETRDGTDNMKGLRVGVEGVLRGPGTMALCVTMALPTHSMLSAAATMVYTCLCLGVCKI